MLLCLACNPKPQQSAMDAAISEILDACRLAQDLENSLRLSAVPVDPQYLLTSSEEIAAAFHKAAARLRSLSTVPYPDQPLFAGQPSAGISFLLTMPGDAPIYASGGSSSVSEAMALPSEFSGGVSSYVNGPSGADAEGRGRGVARAQRPSRRRREGAVTRLMPALRAGNLDLPPDDGYTWRKYGEKSILNSSFPRSYYRCTHKNFYGCEAKKQVQRLDDDPSMFQVTYCGVHTCQTSPTPLLIPTSLAPGDATAANDNTGRGSGGGSVEAANLQPIVTTSQLPATSIQLPFSWMERNPRSMLHAPPRQLLPSGRDADGSVEELARAMFNPGSSSGSSMEVILSPKQRN